jgi:hypothetical protein
MSRFNQLPEFSKEFLRLSKRYGSLSEDMEKFERFISENPTGLGKNFTIIHSSPEVKIVKARMMCKSLKERSIRMIYACHEEVLTFVHIEIYFKGDKVNEDSARIKEYLSSLKKPNK